MSELARLLPHEFAQVYYDAFGELPPRDFLEAYWILCDAFYYGTSVAEPGEESKRGKRFHAGIFFGEARLFGFKAATDRRLAAIRSALRTWTAESAREEARRQGPAADRGGHRAEARGVRPRDTADGGQEA